MTTTPPPAWRWRRVLPLLVLFGALAAWVAGCKQKEGERCQVNDDCESPLVCNQATQECSRTTGGGIDASVPDGPIDAPVDAAVDAAVDAPIDTTFN